MAASSSVRVERNLVHVCTECQHNIGLMPKPPSYTCDHRVCYRCFEYSDADYCRFCHDRRKAASSSATPTKEHAD